MTLNIVVPMAGEGSRFDAQGFTFPKPLIQMPDGNPMIKMVMDCLEIYDANWIFIVRKEHEEKYKLRQILPRMLDEWKPAGIQVRELHRTTEGAACTVLEVEDLIGGDDPLIVVNSDQYFVWDSGDFLSYMHDAEADGGILTFKSFHPKWSFAKVEDGLITHVAEKEPISSNATVGFYWWKHGRLFIDAAKQMIAGGRRVNGEFYVAPTYNEMIVKNMKILPYEVDFMAGVGTPEDLRKFEIMAWTGKVPRYG
jgi:NDP-sugar pyrophosphorylase family protein